MLALIGTEHGLQKNLVPLPILDFLGLIIFKVFALKQKKAQNFIIFSWIENDKIRNYKQNKDAIGRYSKYIIGTSVSNK